MLGILVAKSRTKPGLLDSTAICNLVIPSKPRLNVLLVPVGFEVQTKHEACCGVLGASLAPGRGNVGAWQIQYIYLNLYGFSKSHVSRPIYSLCVYVYIYI